MKIELDRKQLDQALSAIEKFAGKKARQKFKNAFNRAGFDTRKRMIDHIGKVFDNPNQYTRNAPYFEQFKFKDGAGIGGSLSFRKKASKGVGAGIYLMPQEWGGSRAYKGFEIRLRRMGILQDGQFAVPTKQMPRSSRNPAALNKLATDLGKGITRVSNQKRKTRANYERYFVLRKVSGNLQPGIYARGERRSLIRLFAFVDKITYRKIFGFYQQANKDFVELFKEKLRDEASKE